MTEPNDAPQRTAVVTGGSRGLGRGVVEAFAAAGMRVVVIARDPARLSALASEVPNVVAVPGDAADGALAERVLHDHAPDVVVLAAGAPPGLAALHEQTWETFSRNWEVDTKSAFVWLRAALLAPLKPGGEVVVVSSGAATHGSPISGGYAGAKRTQWFIAEYAATEVMRLGRGFRIHCLLPNLNPSTELGRAAIAAYAARSGVTPDEFGKRFNPPLTPAIMGQGVLELISAPARFPDLAYRIGGAGLAPLG